MFIAWHMAALSRTKRLPKLERLLKGIRGEKAKAMSGMDMKEFFKSLAGTTPADLSPKEQRALARKRKAHGER